MNIAPIVFLSSTKQDLEEYRTEILKNLPRLDILYRGMELFGARAQRAKEVMLEEVRESDLFVGLLGHCYGSEDPETGLSYTELEYREARRAGLPILWYIIDSSVPHRDDQTETGPKRAKLRRLKEEVKQQLTCAYFTNVSQLATLVGQGIQRWLHETTSVRAEQYMASRDFDATEKRLLCDLYAADVAAVTCACEKLARSGAVRALEHFYALIRLRSNEETVVRAAFKAMCIIAGHRRVSEILLEFINDPNPTLRHLAMGTVTECARSATGWISLELSEAVLTLATRPDEDWHVRWEVAHALPKVASKCPALANRCRSTLTRVLADDASAAVRSKAEESLRDMGPERPVSSAPSNAKGGAPVQG